MMWIKEWFNKFFIKIKSNEKQQNEEDIKNRKEFLTQISKYIDTKHFLRGESLICGISGKWGEGKTKFLEELEVELYEKNKDYDDKIYKVIWINAWKYSSERITFLRNFLRALSPLRIQNCKWTCPFKYVKNYFEDRRVEKKLLNNETRNTIKVVWFLVIMVILIIVAIIWNHELLPENVITLIQNNMVIVKVFFLPLILPITLGLITSNSSNNMVSTLDEFDKLLDTYIKLSKNYRIVVFVDDLDRISPQASKIVLDNLRTFFDRPELTFVVTGDHTILEGQLGKQLKPDEDYSVQLMEGRRFLKKIFNLYWRLPIPLKSEIKNFIKIEIIKRPVITSMLTDEKIEILSKYLMKYFGGNFREILRFLDSVVFTFQTVDTLVTENCENKHFAELQKYPLLIVRVMMIEEHCNQFFERILKDPTIFTRLDYLAQKADVDNVIAELDEYKKSMSSEQMEFIKSFIFESPLFHDEKLSSKVRSIETFLYLSTDGFSDMRGVSGEDFTKLLNEKKEKLLTSSLFDSGEQRLNEAVTATLAVCEAKEAKEYIPILTTLFRSLISIDSEHLSQSIFLNRIMEIKFSSEFQQLQSNERMSFLTAYWNWLDKILKVVNDKFQTYRNLFTLNHANLNEIITIKRSFNIFSTSVIFNNIISLYKSNQVEATRIAIEILENSLYPLKSKEFVTFISVIANDLLPNLNNTSLANNIYKLVSKNPEELHKLNNKLLNAIRDLNPSIWQFLIQKIEQSGLSQKEMERELLHKVKGVEDMNELYRVLDYLSNKVSELKKDLWAILLEKEDFILKENLVILTTKSNYVNIAPTENEAKHLFTLIYNYSKLFSQEDIDKRIQFLRYLNKSLWLWKNLSQLPLRKNMTPIMRSNNQQLKDVVTNIITSWKVD